MVAKINISKNIAAALNYNEKKVQNGKAVCLYAANYLSDAKQMNFHQKLNGFENLNILNKRASTNTNHVSLNFDPAENLSEQKLVEIASVYMEKIGFGKQPFLVYKHEDAGHPHIHIVSTTITENGRRINTHNIGRNQSEKARKEIEQQYQLVKAEKQRKILHEGIRPLNIEKAIYGKSETRRGISIVVNTVFNQYNFTSLPEFNAALKQFNVVADRGKEDGWIYRKRGLVFRILDTNGNKIGVPIKASLLHCKPTLSNLETKFFASKSTRDVFKNLTKSIIDECLQSPSDTIKDLVSHLEKKQVYTVLRQNAEGRLYGITFVDNENRCVFNGSDLGKNYSIAALQSRLANSNNEGRKTDAEMDKKQPAAYPLITKKVSREKNIQPLPKAENLLLELLSTKEQMQNVPLDLIKKKRRKKKKNTD